MSWCLQVGCVVGCIWFEVEGCWLDLEQNWRKIPSYFDLREQGCPLDLDMTLYFGSVSSVFLSLFLCLIFSYEMSLFIGNSIAFDLEFSLNIYWELIMNYEFNLVVHFIRIFHMSLFFLKLSHGFLYLMLPHGLISFVDIADIINWKLIW